MLLLYTRLTGNKSTIMTIHFLFVINRLSLPATCLAVTREKLTKRENFICQVVLDLALLCVTKNQHFTCPVHAICNVNILSFGLSTGNLILSFIWVAII